MNVKAQRALNLAASEARQEAERTAAAGALVATSAEKLAVRVDLLDQIARILIALALDELKPKDVEEELRALREKLDPPKETPNDTAGTPATPTR